MRLGLQMLSILLLLLLSSGLVLLASALKLKPMVLLLILGVAFLVICAVWLIIKSRIFFRIFNKKQTRSIFQENSQNILKETREAVKRYTDTVNRKGIFKRSTLYDRPWFLICGGKGSGKSTLLKGSGLSFPMMYPSEKDGLLLEKEERLRWYFANESVWIDSPGGWMQESDSDNWMALASALKKARPQKPADGVVLVVDTNEILAATDQSIKKMASGIRSRIDELLIRWEVEVPVYLLFNKTDLIPGFREFFGGTGKDRIFGATLRLKRNSVAGIEFNNEYKILCKTLSDLRLERLHKEKNASAGRMICRFLIHFESIQKKLGYLTVELFKDSSYGGKPIFRGFYFTSCTAKTKTPAKRTVSSQTIINHPLNPDREFISTETHQTHSDTDNTVDSAFVLPLFREIMVKDKSLVRVTQKGFRRRVFNHYLITGLMFLSCLLIGMFLLKSWRNSQRLFAEIENSISFDLTGKDNITEHYEAIESLRDALDDLTRGSFLKTWPFYRESKRIAADLRRIYFRLAENLIISPAVKYLEYEIKRLTQSYTVSGGRDYNELYTFLKAYLSLSEEIAGRGELIDTAMLRPVLVRAVAATILQTSNSQRLPSGVETLLNNNAYALLYCLKRGELMPVQRNQELVAAARKCLSRIPGADALYSKAAGEIIGELPRITLKDLLGNSGEGLLRSSRSVSIFYTQEGFDQYVDRIIEDVSDNPFKTDWVVNVGEEKVDSDRKNLKAGVLSAYLKDCRNQWLGFLNSVDLETTGDIRHSANILNKLSGEYSEIGLLFSKVAEYAVIDDKKKIGQERPLISEIHGKVKKLKDATAQSPIKLFTSDDSLHFEEHNRYFRRLRSFANSNNGPESGLAGYRNRMAVLAQQLLKIAENGGSSAPDVFNGKEDDPLYNCMRFSERCLGLFPDEMSLSIRKILMRPLWLSSSAVTRTVEEALNVSWKSEVAGPFNNRLKGHYPFAKNGTDVSLDEVREFFHPVSGTFWGFFNRKLSSHVVKTHSGWKEKNGGSIDITLDKNLISSLAAAERIKDFLFRSDGSPRIFSVNFGSSLNNRNRAAFSYGESEHALLPGGKPILFKWPAEKSVALRVEAGSGGHEFVYKGDWCVLKLFGSSRKRESSANILRAGWQFNVQNMYMVFFDARIESSGEIAIFEDCFSGFVCPEMICRK